MACVVHSQHAIERIGDVRGVDGSRTRFRAAVHFVCDGLPASADDGQVECQIALEQLTAADGSMRAPQSCWIQAARMPRVEAYRLVLSGSYHGTSARFVQGRRLAC